MSTGDRFHDGFEDDERTPDVRYIHAVEEAHTDAQAPNSDSDATHNDAEDGAGGGSCVSVLGKRRH